MAAPLSILISDPNGCLTFQIFGLTVVSGQACKNLEWNHAVCALFGCSAFRGSDRFTVTKSVQKGRGICLSRRDLPVISALVAIRQTHAREDTLPNGISQVSPAVNHCFAHGTWNHAIDRCYKAHHCYNGLLPLPVAPPKNATIAPSSQVPFRFAPATGRAPCY
jgi:hypothetical protein